MSEKTFSFLLESICEWHKCSALSYLSSPDYKEFPGSYQALLSQVFQQFCEMLTKAKEENEMFKKQEARKLQREQKAAEERERKAKLGITEDAPTTKKGKRPPPKEEKCIIDNLLDEVRWNIF